MSMNDLQQFRAQLATSDELRAACFQAFQDKNPEDVYRIARERGFDFGDAEVIECMESAELSDMELELVSGGTPCAPPTTTQWGSSGERV